MYIDKQLFGVSKNTLDLGVIIPTLGASLDSLRITLESIAYLDEKPLVVVVAKSNSVALSRLLAEYEADLIHEPNLGLYQALNRGVEEIEFRCDYFTFLGDDDFLEKEGFERLCEEGKKGVADIIYGGINYVDLSGSTLFTNFSFPFATKILCWAPNFIPNPGTIIRVEIWKNLNGYDEKYLLASDLDFWIRARKIATFKHVKAVAANFRFAGNSLTFSQRSKSIDESREIRKKHLGKLSLLLFIAWDPIQIRIAEALLRFKVRLKA